MTRAQNVQNHTITQEKAPAMMMKIIVELLFVARNGINVYKHEYNIRWINMQNGDAFLSEL